MYEPAPEPAIPQLQNNVARCRDGKSLSHREFVAAMRDISF